MTAATINSLAGASGSYVTFFDAGVISSRPDPVSLDWRPRAQRESRHESLESPRSATDPQAGDAAGRPGRHRRLHLRLDRGPGGGSGRAPEPPQIVHPALDV